MNIIKLFARLLHAHLPPHARTPGICCLLVCWFLVVLFVSCCCVRLGQVFGWTFTTTLFSFSALHTHTALTSHTPFHHFFFFLAAFCTAHCTLLSTTFCPFFLPLSFALFLFYFHLHTERREEKESNGRRVDIGQAGRYRAWAQHHLTCHYATPSPCAYTHLLRCFPLVVREYHGAFYK